MHFVGNRAIILGKGESEIQLYYNATYTTVSAILPIVVIFLGLLAADRFYKGNKNATTRYIALLICGVCCGASVTEMHYLGNQGTTNYRIKSVPEYVVGAAAIAIGACLIAFSLFFHWSGHWMNVIWRRIIVACFLAVAVCGMHWTAAAGTSYEIRGYHPGSGSARNINVIIAVCLVSLIQPPKLASGSNKNSVLQLVVYALQSGSSSSDKVGESVTVRSKSYLPWRRSILRAESSLHRVACCLLKRSLDSSNGRLVL
jgi:NO-binding membrane sensor protein with MHYT domain